MNIIFPIMWFTVTICTKAHIITSNLLKVWITSKTDFEKSVYIGFVNHGCTDHSKPNKYLRSQNVRYGELQVQVSV